MVLPTRRRTRCRAKSKQQNQQLINLPLDVFIEIFRLLEPLDLLHLSRTTKGLRDFLLNPRKSSTLWKDAINKVDVPPCPDFMSAPAYTHLAFDLVCHGCGCTCETVEWELRMRCCPDCFRKMTVPETDVRGKRYKYLEGVNLPSATHYHRISDSNFVTVKVDCTILHPARVSISDWKVAISRKRASKLSVGEYVDRENAFWNPIRMHARVLKDWELGRLRAKANQLTLVRNQRVQDIRKELNQLGCADVVSSVHDLGFSKLPQVLKLEPLTPTERTGIRPQLIGWARKARKEMIWIDCLNTLTSVSQSILLGLNGDTSLKLKPRLVDIAMLPAVYPVLESSVNSECNQEMLRKKLHRMLPPAIKEWSLGAVEELKQLARTQSLDLPTHSVVFECKHCSQIWRPHRKRHTFDEALSHTHLYTGHDDKDAKDDSFDELSPYDRFLMRYEARNTRVLRVDVNASRRVDNLIRRMGRNPTRVTLDELRRSTVKVACILCRQHAMTMSFEQAFKHCLTFHLWNWQTEVWTRVSARSENAQTGSNA